MKFMGQSLACSQGSKKDRYLFICRLKKKSLVITPGGGCDYFQFTDEGRPSTCPKSHSEELVELGFESIFVPSPQLPRENPGASFYEGLQLLPEAAPTG